MVMHPIVLVLLDMFEQAESYIQDVLGINLEGLGDFSITIPYADEFMDLILSAEFGALSAPVLLLAAGITIFFGVAGESFFKKTGIPDVAFLLVLGVIIGPVLGIVEQDLVITIVPYFAAVALIIIMFDGGLNLDLKHLVKIGHLAIILAIIGFIVALATVAALAHYLIGWNWLDSILLGSIVGGSSSIIVFGLVRSVSITEETKNMLAFESAVTDILSTIIAFTMFGVVLAGALDVAVMAETLGRAVVVGIVLGLGVGIPWMYITTKLQTKHTYMLTLGVLFVLYFGATYFGESGALTALVFGLMLGNKDKFTRVFKFQMRRVDKDDSMHNQLTFLIRVFFFVIVGLLASFGDIMLVLFGVIATVAIYFGRVIIVKAMLGRRISALDQRVTSVMIPRGLAAAVLASLPLTMGIPNAEAYPQIVFFIILASVIITTIGMGSAKKISTPQSQAGGFISLDEERRGL